MAEHESQAITDMGALCELQLCLKLDQGAEVEHVRGGGAATGVK